MYASNEHLWFRRYYSPATKHLFCLLAIVASLSAANAQTMQVKPNPSGAGEFTGWQKLDLGIFEFYAPKELKGGERQGVDSRVWKYESNDLILVIDAGLYSGFPTVERRWLSYQEKFLKVDGASARMWFHENEANESGYAGGVNFSFKGLNESITMYLRSKDSRVKEIAEKMFKSVKFKFKRTPNRPQPN